MVDKKPEKGFAKVCYYELLEVDRKADTKTIKKVSNYYSDLKNLGIPKSST
jgi:hypothetical protein